MRFGRLIFTAAAAAAATLTFASPAFAVATLNPMQVPTTAATFQTKDCNAFPAPGVPAGMDGWHFVLPAATADDFVSVTLTFNPGTPSVTITSHDPTMPTTGLGFSGYIVSAGMSGQDKHLYLFTTAGWTLTGGTAVTNPMVDTGNFQLSHTCPGTPTTPTPTASVPPPPNMSATPTPPPPPNMSGTPTPPPTATTAPSGGAGTGGGGSYGVSAMGVGAIVVASGAGVALFVARRRRNIGA